jgi:putative heme transporter
MRSSRANGGERSAGQLGAEAPEPQPANPKHETQPDAGVSDATELLENEREALDEDAGAVALSPRRLAIFAGIVVAALVGLYVALPAALDGLSELGDVVARADPVWLVVAMGFNVGSFVAYIALFRGVIGGHTELGQTRSRIDWKVSYEITMAGLAATRLFAAAGAGGIALTYWALRRAGMARRDAAQRMVAFLVLLYIVYAASVVVFGVLLRVGVLPGPSPVGMTIIPAAVAGVAIIVFLLFTMIPQDVERRLANWSRGYRRRAVWLRRLAAVPALVASGTRTAMEIARHPREGLPAILGAIGFWAANIAVLWACFHAFGEGVPKGVLIQGFFVGMAANLLPFFPGGVGSVDAGMIAAFLAFDEPASTVIVSVLAYRVIAFWLPILPGAIAYIQLRRTVSQWRAAGVRAP